MLSVALSLPPRFLGDAVGLTGLYSGDQSDDFLYRDGETFLNMSASEREIYNWAMSCTSLIPSYTKDHMSRVPPTLNVPTFV